MTKLKTIRSGRFGTINGATLNCNVCGKCGMGVEFGKENEHVCSETTNFNRHMRRAIAKQQKKLK